MRRYFSPLHVIRQRNGQNLTPNWYSSGCQALLSKGSWLECLSRGRESAWINTSIGTSFWISRKQRNSRSVEPMKLCAKRGPSSLGSCGYIYFREMSRRYFGQYIFSMALASHDLYSMIVNHPHLLIAFKGTHSPLNSNGHAICGWVDQ